MFLSSSIIRHFLSRSCNWPWFVSPDCLLARQPSVESACVARTRIPHLTTSQQPRPRRNNNLALTALKQHPQKHTFDTGFLRPVSGFHFGHAVWNRDKPRKGGCGTKWRMPAKPLAEYDFACPVLYVLLTLLLQACNCSNGQAAAFAFEELVIC